MEVLDAFFDQKLGQAQLFVHEASREGDVSMQEVKDHTPSLPVEDESKQFAFIVDTVHRRLLKCPAASGETSLPSTTELLHPVGHWGVVSRGPPRLIQD